MVSGVNAIKPDKANQKKKIMIKTRIVCIVEHKT